MDKNKRLVCVGKIVAAHGIKGEVKIHSYTEDPEGIARYSPLRNHAGDPVFHVKIRSSSGRILIAAVDGVSTRTEAEALSKKELFISRDQFPVLEEENTFYLEDLKGLSVISENTRSVYGVVKDVYNFGASDIIAILDAQTAKEELFPFTHDVFPEINISEGYMLIATEDVSFLLNQAP